MNVFRGIEELPPTVGRTRPWVATIGNFDGVHRGHQWVIAEVIARAATLQAKSLAITFDPHPARVLRPETPLRLITPTAQKLELLQATGIEAALVLPFEPALYRLSARQFAEQILAKAIGVVEVHEGENFRFGFNAEAGVDGLETLGKELGFAVRIYSPRNLRGAPVSSSRVRALIAAGDVGTARALLGRSFSISSEPATGRGYGTRYTVPTINLALYTDLLPAHGVYCTTMRVAGEEFQAVTNVGNRPTFGEDSFTVESYLLNFHPLNLTQSTPLQLTFYKRLREERKWPSPEALRHQIAIDVARATRFFSLCSVLGRAKPDEAAAEQL